MGTRSLTAWSVEGRAVIWRLPMAILWWATLGSVRVLNPPSHRPDSVFAKARIEQI